jgi:hypothetical protein
MTIHRGTKFGALISYYQKACKKLASKEICLSFLESIKTVIQAGGTEIEQLLLHGKG